MRRKVIWIFSEKHCLLLVGRSRVSMLCISSIRAVGHFVLFNLFTFIRGIPTTTTTRTTNDQRQHQQNRFEAKLSMFPDMINLYVGHELLFMSSIKISGCWHTASNGSPLTERKKKSMNKQILNHFTQIVFSNSHSQQFDIVLVL